MTAKHALVGGMAGFLLLYAFVLLSGQTFGQRCTAMGKSGAEHAKCVTELASGETAK